MSETHTPIRPATDEEMRHIDACQCGALNEEYPCRCQGLKARVRARIEADRETIAELLAALERVGKWCHQGHGFFPAIQCGLCKPILAAIQKAKESHDTDR